MVLSVPKNWDQLITMMVVLVQPIKVLWNTLQIDTLFHVYDKGLVWPPVCHIPPRCIVLPWPRVVDIIHTTEIDLYIRQSCTIFYLPVLHAVDTLYTPPLPVWDTPQRCRVDVSEWLFFQHRVSSILLLLVQYWYMCRLYTVFLFGFFWLVEGRYRRFFRHHYYFSLEMV